MEKLRLRAHECDSPRATQPTRGEADSPEVPRLMLFPPQEAPGTALTIRAHSIILEDLAAAILGSIKMQLI